MKLFRYIAFPFVPIYYLVTWLRNKLYDLGIKHSKSYPLPLICVGNISAGGTGKTPMVEYLIRLLYAEKPLATLSRGYGRKTKGFVLASEASNAENLGDEPFQFYSKFSKDIAVAVSESRQMGIEQLLKLKPKTELIILDDAFQHRKVSAGLNILLTTYSNLYTSDWVLPTGDLREPRAGAKRAQIIVVTKCPSELSEAKKNSILKKINPESHQQVFFASISYAKDLVSKTNTIPLKTVKKATLVTGIANAIPLVNYLKANDLNCEHLNFKDHYHFTEADAEKLAVHECIITTEKDFMRLKTFSILNDKLYYLPIETEIEEASEFDALVKTFVSDFKA
jgi:tetraacyldisaccharide 4'-kinase